MENGLFTLLLLDLQLLYYSLYENVQTLKGSKYIACFSSRCAMIGNYLFFVWTIMNKSNCLGNPQNESKISLLYVFAWFLAHDWARRIRIYQLCKAKRKTHFHKFIPKRKKKKDEKWFTGSFYRLQCFPAFLTSYPY